MTTAHIIEQAVRILRSGGLVAFPTETVYGLGADAMNPHAVARIFAVKGRPAAHPLIVHLRSAADLPDWTDAVPPAARALAERFWPGPLTLILRRNPRVPLVVTGGLETIGVRVPAHPVARDLLAAFGSGIAAPSANRFGSISPTMAQHVREDLGDAVDLIVDGGRSDIGLESTIVDASGERPAILRPGGVSAEAISEALGVQVGIPGRSLVRAPGQHPSHYAPRARVLLAPPERIVEEGVRLVRDGHRVGLLLPAAAERPAEPGLVVLVAPEPPEAFAHEMYELLREFDRQECDVVVTSVPPERGLGLAIADRLRRAAGPRD